MDDKQLYQKFLEGDKIAFEQLVTKYKNNLKYFIYKYVKNEDVAEDIFQDTTMYLLTRKEIYNEKYSFKTFLYMVAKSRALNYVKKDNSINVVTEENIYVEEKMLEDIIISNERKEKIKNVICKMNEEYKEAIYLGVIEGLSYNEIAKIMGKTPGQIKNLLHRARVKLRKLLIEEKVVEMKNNKVISFLIAIIIVGIITTGVVVAVKHNKGRVNMTPTFTSNISDTDINKVWVGTFNLVWNDLMNDVIGGPIEFEGETPELAKELNKQTFTAKELSESSYYKKHGYATFELKKEIENGIKKKFKENSNVLDRVDWGSREGYVLYAMLKKEFEYLEMFPALPAAKFGNSTEKVKYFGLDATTPRDAAKNVEILFHNSKDDLAVKLKTKQGDEVYLYKTTGEGKSFEQNFEELKAKEANYIKEFSFERNKQLATNDVLKIPYIKLNEEINYDELCGKFIKGTDWYIRQALQTIDFKLNNAGGSVKSEALMELRKSAVMDMNKREFVFDSDFILFLKEENKNKPYFALKIDNTDVLVEE